MRIIITTIFILLSLINIGCAHYHKVEGVQERTEIPEGMRVKIGSKEVQEGDFVDVFKAKCTKKRMHRYDTDFNRCVYEKIGKTQVIKVLTSDTAVVSHPEDFIIDNDMYIERIEEN